MLSPFVVSTLEMKLARGTLRAGSYICHSSFGLIGSGEVVSVGRMVYAIRGM